MVRSILDNYGPFRSCVKRIIARLEMYNGVVLWDSNKNSVPQKRDALLTSLFPSLEPNFGNADFGIFLNTAIGYLGTNLKAFGSSSVRK